MEEFPPAPDVAGTSLDGTAIFTISADENAALCKSTGVEPASDGTAHPIYYYIATQVAMGKSVAQVDTCVISFARVSAICKRPLVGTQANSLS